MTGRFRFSFFCCCCSFRFWVGVLVGRGWMLAMRCCVVRWVLSYVGYRSSGGNASGWLENYDGTIYTRFVAHGTVYIYILVAFAIDILPWGTATWVTTAVYWGGSGIYQYTGRAWYRFGLCGPGSDSRTKVGISIYFTNVLPLCPRRLRSRIMANCR